MNMEYKISDDNRAVASAWEADSLERLANKYNEYGFVLVENLFSERELDILRDGFIELMNSPDATAVLENDQQTIRSVHRPHDRKDIFWRLSSDARLVVPTKSILGKDIYVYQAKLNSKMAKVGDAWPWHRDFTYWHEEDGMQLPHALTAAVFLDDVTVENGPIKFIPGSQHAQEVPGMVNKNTGSASNDWISGFTSNPAYTISDEYADRLISQHGVVTMTGRRGSLLIFSCTSIHSSTRNYSASDRLMALVSYNAVDNLLSRSSESRRPAFIVNYDSTAIEPAVGPIESSFATVKAGKVKTTSEGSVADT